MKTRYVLALLLGMAAALTGITCAPVDPAASDAAREAPTNTKAPAPPPGNINMALPGPLVPTNGAAPAPPDALKTRIDAAIALIRRRELRTDNGFWTVFHGILGLGPSVELVNPETGKHVNALDYIAGGGKLPGLSFKPTAQGLDVETMPGTFVGQGHQDQFVAEMVEWGVAPERKFVVDGKDYTFDDFLRYSKARASVKQSQPQPQELEWAIVIISTRYGTDISWTNAAGEELRFEDLMRAEVDKDVDKAACGGTHLLFGLTWAYHLHLQKGGQMTGVWKDVADRIALYKRRAREQQNVDGSFSTEYFRDRGSAPDMGQRIATTGHIFEWLALALSDEELKEPWVQGAANALSLMFLENQDKGIEGGAMYHAVHGLIIYSSRVYGSDKLGPLAPHLPLLPKQKS
jgi:hypothetical protein